ncbi:50S ribosomal protein L1 [Candidatus Cerribacteria bacterium 'Amazon FNV 2010 28 9']|uniref:Large ribosomal subunit protein uL1 n=1 Tax=Candidatus Cerribacteria bacterium 'Amazon FNV 2010 28 9' TaxID=2081795 RepID=A0A317JTY5_9BACT|nr:MAG: 50S ribosomal protein L1 [Candidatus Cerribacteria bacterium 'Amazon FNV 2010 28 9']
MSKTKFKTVEMSGESSKKKSYEEKRAAKSANRAADEMAEIEAGMGEVVIDETSTTPIVEEAQTEEVKVEKKSQVARRGKHYVTAHGKVDRKQIYAVEDALELLKKTKYAKFDESVEVHLVTKDIMSNVEVAFPHSTGKTIRVAIVNDDVIANLEKGIIDFDVLIATPAQMGKITKFARLLGPKGLMPNPKNGTLTANPDKKKADLEGGRTTIRGEKKAPLMHVLIGKASMDTKDLADNIATLVKAVGPTKITKMVVCTTMSPSVRIVVA